MHINKQELSIYYDNKEIHAKKYYSWLCCTFWASYWHIKYKINWERTFKRLHNCAIYRKNCFFLGSSKEVPKEPPQLFYKETVLKNSAIFAGKHLCWSRSNCIKKGHRRSRVTVNTADILRKTFLQNTPGRLILEAESENISQWWLNYYLQKE